MLLLRDKQSSSSSSTSSLPSSSSSSSSPCSSLLLLPACSPSSLELPALLTIKLLLLRLSSALGELLAAAGSRKRPVSSGVDGGSAVMLPLLLNLSEGEQSSPLSPEDMYGGEADADSSCTGAFILRRERTWWR
jgi:hypothetical protein